MIYVATNSLVTMSAVTVVELFGWTFGLPAASEPVKTRTVQVLVAGFSAMALLRSSLFTVRVGNQDFGVGLNAVAQAFLRAADAAVDRRRGVARDYSVQVMDNVAFDKAVAVLPIAWA